MPPKGAKETAARKPPPQIARPSISESSLYVTPEDIIEGFQERLETGIDWTSFELSNRHHKKRCKEGSAVTFSEALQTKIENSIFGSILNEESTLSLDQQWELLLPITLWDNEKFATDEGKICFKNANNITDDMMKMIKRTVILGDRNILRKELKLVNVLRVNDCMMTELDDKLGEFKKLVTLNISSNYIVHLDANLIPRSVKSIELQANCIQSLQFSEHLPHELLYLGLASNCLNNESVEGFSRLPSFLSVLDLSDNDICDLDIVLDGLSHLPNLSSLMLAGNPCSVCMGYAKITLLRLPRLRWLDLREILPTDRPENEHFEPHPDDVRSSYFYFSVLRIMSAAMPPKPEKGATCTFHVELEIPLLDCQRRRFLMYRNNESLTEMLPPPEDDGIEELPTKLPSAVIESKSFAADEMSSHESDIYKVLTAKNSLEIRNYKTFESNRIQWNKVMNFTEPTVKIFCPDLAALRNTFRTVITVRFVYSLTQSAKTGKPDKKSQHLLRVPNEQRVVIATIRCALQRSDWSRPYQHFHWDDLLGTEDAIHWGDGDLAAIQYSQVPGKATKGKADAVQDSRQFPPDNLTCHFCFGIETLRT